MSNLNHEFNKLVDDIKEKIEEKEEEMEKLIAVNRVKLTDALTMGAKTGRDFISENIISFETLSK